MLIADVVENSGIIGEGGEPVGVCAGWRRGREMGSESDGRSSAGVWTIIQSSELNGCRFKLGVDDGCEEAVEGLEGLVAFMSGLS